MMSVIKARDSSQQIPTMLLTLSRLCLAFCHVQSLFSTLASSAPWCVLVCSFPCLIFSIFEVNGLLYNYPEYSAILKYLSLILNLIAFTYPALIVKLLLSRKCKM